MSWSKLKTIIICILLLLNLFLLGLVGVNRLRARRYQDAALTEAVAVLAHNNIRAERETLPGEMTLSAASTARDLLKEEELIRAFLGDDMTVSASGGGLYIYEGQTTAGTASFRGNGEFTVSYEVPHSQSGTPRDIMKQLDLDTGDVREEEGLLTTEQRLNGVPVYSAGTASQDVAGMTFLYDSQGRLSAVSGRLLLGRLSAEPEETKPVSVSTGLMAFLGFIVDSGDICREIVAMTPVYRASGDPVRLTPAWLIQTDAGGYFVDALSAEVSRVPAQ